MWFDAAVVATLFDGEKKTTQKQKYEMCTYAEIIFLGTEFLMTLWISDV